MRKSKLGILMLVLALLLVFTAGCGGQAEKDKGQADTEKIKVGFIYIGVPGDAGFTYSHDQGRQYLEKEIPEIETAILENVHEGADVERSLEQLIQDGCNIIVANSFGYGDAVLAVAKKYPDVKFLHCSGLDTEKNVSTYFGRIYQARYLSGMVAGAMTKNNSLGYVAAYKIPEVVRGINAYTLGAQAVNPNVKVKVVWTNTWFDPTKEKEAAKSLLETGCDVIAQHQDTPSAQQAAEEAGKYSIGYNSDMSKFAPNANLTSPVWNWGPYYVKTVKAVMDGTWKSEAYWGGLEDGIVDLAPISDKVPADIKKQVEAKKKEMTDKEWDVFTGPIKAQDGTVKVPEGKKMTDAEMLSFDWFVAGVEGNIGK
ncbi:BMP family ABC transporter substrate-binding protein [Syntrophomonas wolfei]|uniref:BMP family ABC transporter substrate-binding protein n=1 Tax=Syntrophomonas wolfei TaxID=863 RepID=UPI0023F0E532|nr:BMP family ABC transporter substrate-binding protein [Syntrophomonas wolfei]